MKECAINQVKRNTCVLCEKEFEKKSNNQQFCSAKCRSSMNRTKCLECGKPFKPSDNKHIFCKPECNKRKNAQLKGSSKTKE